MQLLTNNATSELAAGIAAPATSLTIKTGDGAKFPNPAAGDDFLITLFQRVGTVELNHEIVKCTARAGDVLTIVRGLEGTTARAFGAGDPIELRLTAGAVLPVRDGALTGALNEAPPVTLASAASMTVGSAKANSINVTGTTTISAFDSAPIGAVRRLNFSGALTLTHNAASMKLLTGASIVTAAGDYADFVSLGSSNWAMTNYSRATGVPIGRVTVAQGGTGTGTLSGLVHGNGTGAMTAATQAQIFTAMGFTPSQLLEYANLGLFPTTGAAGKIYAATDTDRIYRWNGSAYEELAKAPATTDDLTEGATKKYFSEALARTTLLTGLSTATATAIGTGDSILSGLGKAQAQINNRATKGANTDITSLGGLTTALSIAQGGTGAATAAAALTNIGAFPAAGGTINGGLSVTGTTVMGQGAAGAYNGYASGLTLNYAGSGSEYGLTMRPTTSTQTTAALTFLASNSTPAAPVAMSAIEHLVSNGGMNMTGSWKYKGSEILTRAGGEMGGITLTEGANLNLRATAAGDHGDLVWVNSDGTEKHRLFDSAGVLSYRVNGGTAGPIWHSGNMNAPAVNAVANSTVQRDANGYLQGSYVHMSDEGVASGGGNGGVVTAIITKQGNDYYRSTNKTSVKTFLAMRGNEVSTSAADATADIGAAQMLRWKNYGNNHVIFDASQGTAPNGAAVGKVNPVNNWSSSYPTLMGWNGTDTYGVRVDSARRADSAGNSDTTSQTTIGRVGTAGIGYGSYGSVNISGQTGGYSGFSFSDFNVALMINATYSGMYKNNNTWQWRWDDGVLAIGTVPAARIDGTVASAARLTGQAYTNGSDGWFRSQGQHGWYNETYGVGIYAIDAGYVRTYNGAAMVASSFHGSGSGLNGYGASFKAGDTNSVAGATWGGYAWTGQQTFHQNMGNYGVHVGYLTQFQSTDSHACGFTFHRAGYWAINMTLDVDNHIRIGGISAGAGVTNFTFNPEGHFTARNNVIAYSDGRLKTAWEDVAPDFIERLAEVKHGTYLRTDSKSNERQAGVRAQDFLSFFPEVVPLQTDGYYGMNYGPAAAVAAIQLAQRVVEQAAEINSLKGQMAAVFERLTALEKA